MTVGRWWETWRTNVTQAGSQAYMGRRANAVSMLAQHQAYWPCQAWIYQTANCCRNSWLVVDEDDLKWVTNEKNVNCSIQMFLGFKILGHSSVVKAACLERRRSLVWPPLWHPNSKEQNVSSPLTCKDSIFWGASVTERYRARPQTARGRILNSVSEGQCHLNHLTILRRFSWPNLAYRWPKTPFI